MKSCATRCNNSDKSVHFIKVCVHTWRFVTAKVSELVTTCGKYNEKETTSMDKYEIGDIVRLKKQHPCGSSEWEVLRVGADFRLKCAGCGHQIMIARKLVEKNTKEIRKKA